MTRKHLSTPRRSTAAAPAAGARRRVALLTCVAAVCAAAAACAEKPTPPALTQSALADSADQVMWGVNTVLTERGMLQAELLADTGFFFDENTRIEMRGVKLTFYSKTGEKTSVLTSRQGTYNTRLSQAEARGDVVVNSEDGRHLTTSQLKFDQNRNEISSDSAFVMTETGGRRVQGVGFTSDPNMRNLKTRLIQGENFRLPGQTP